MAENDAPDITALREMNLNSIDVMTKALQRYKELRHGAAASPMLQDHIDAEISTLELELRISTIVQTRLQAAAVTVKPLDPESAQRLDALAATIDETIERDAVVNATLTGVTDFIERAKAVRDLVKSSTAVPGE